jgi:hypothetical protein
MVLASEGTNPALARGYAAISFSETILCFAARGEPAIASAECPDSIQYGRRPSPT